MFREVISSKVRENTYIKKIIIIRASLLFLAVLQRVQSLSRIREKHFHTFPRECSIELGDFYFIPTLLRGPKSFSRGTGHM